MAYVCKRINTLISYYFKGRQGRGAVTVFAAGNGHIYKNNCGYNGYVNSLYTMAISMVNRDNSVSRLSERCAGIAAVAYTKDGWRDIRDCRKDPMVSHKSVKFLSREMTLQLC